MQSIPVTSNLLTAAQYDPTAQQLFLTFKSGARWAYGSAAQPFTQADADSLAGAASAGSHFLQNIKGSFPERRA